MKKKYIVKTKEEFNKIIETGICKKNKYFIIYYNKNEKKHDCYGVSVGKKIGNAVNRNKYKRRIRNIIYIYMKEKKSIDNNNYIIIMRKSALDISFEKLKENLIILLEGAKK